MQRYLKCILLVKKKNSSKERNHCSLVPSHQNPKLLDIQGGSRRAEDDYATPDHEYSIIKQTVLLNKGPVQKPPTKLQ